MNTYVITPCDHDRYPETFGYTAIKRLAEMVHAADIPYSFHRCWDGWQIEVNTEFFHTDAIQHNGSYGHERDLLETMGFPEDEGDVTGYLTAEEVFERVQHLVNPAIGAAKNEDE